jgi:hypothetical protein
MLAEQSFDCMIVDLALRDMAGGALLERAERIGRNVQETLGADRHGEAVMAGLGWDWSGAQRSGAAVAVRRGQVFRRPERNGRIGLER